MCTCARIFWTDVRPVSGSVADARCAQLPPILKTRLPPILLSRSSPFEERLRLSSLFERGIFGLQK